MTTTPIPVPGERRASLERAIWITDLIAWVAIIAIGIGITFVQPIVIRATIGSQPALVIGLSGFYVIGGVWGLIVRALKLGLFEMPAVWLASGGLALFGFNAFWAGLSGFPAVVTVAYSVAMVALFTRRILELLALTSDHRMPGWFSRLLRRRRTPSAV